jgi:hypothetical protein
MPLNYNKLNNYKSDKLILKNVSNKHISIGDLNILLSPNESRNLYSQNSFNKSLYRTPEQVCNSRDLEIAILTGIVKIFDKNDNELTPEQAILKTEIGTGSSGSSNGSGTGGDAEYLNGHPASYFTPLATFNNHNHDLTYAILNHNHNGVYSLIDHDHSLNYATLNHNHNGVYSLIDHNHNTTYAALNHNHNGAYSLIDHNHDLTYAALNHNHNGVYSLIDHNHDLTYSAINHAHTAAQVNAVDLAGFTDRTSSILSFNSNRTFTITPNASYVYYSNGSKYTISSPASVVIQNTVGLHFVYYNGASLTTSTSPWIITGTGAPIATVYWNGSAGAISDERHSYNRNRDWHEWAHDTIGTRYSNGLAFTFNSNGTFSFAEGSIFDEDIEQTILTGSSCRLWYRNNTVMTFENNISYCAKLSGNQLYFDNAGTLATVNNNWYVCNYVYATTDIDYPIYIIVGQAQHANVSSARNDTQPTIPNISTREWRLLYRVIMRQGNGSYSYTENADYRTTSSLPGGNVTSLPASSITFTPYGTIAATNVQAAISEMLDEASSNHTHTVDDLSDVTITNPQNGQALIYSYGYGWINDDLAYTSIIDLSDVSILNPTNNQFLRYNGSVWINETVNISGGSGAGVGTTSSRLSSSPSSGSIYYDTTLGFFTIYDGNYWRKYDGSRIESYITVSSVSFAASSYSPGDNLGVNVVFSSAVDIPAGSTIVVTRATGGDFTLYAAAQNNVTTALFNKISDNTANYSIPDANQTYSIGAQTLGGDIEEYNTIFDVASKSISSNQASNAGSRVVVATGTQQSAAVITGVAWKSVSTLTSGTAPYIDVIDPYGHNCWIEVTFDKAVDVTAGAYIAMTISEGPWNQSYVTSQSPIYAAAQTNVTKVLFKYTNSGATSLFYTENAQDYYRYSACAIGTANEVADFPYTIQGTIKNTGTETSANKEIESSDFPYYRLENGY